MGWYRIVKSLGAILTALATAIGIASNTTQIINLDIKWWLPISFILFIAFVCWIILDLRRTNNRLLEERPSITMSPVEESGFYYLNVHNNGGTAKFKAQIELLPNESSTLPVYTPGTYYGFWETTKKDYAEIFKGHEGRIIIAEKKWAPHYSSVHLRIFFHDSRYGQPSHVDMPNHFMGGLIEPLNAPTVSGYKLCVVISSEPSLRDDVYKADYIISINGLEKVQKV